jgi:zinc protease
VTDERHAGEHDHEDDPRSGFLTDQDLEVGAEPEADPLLEAPAAATVLTPEAVPDLSVLERRPVPGPPREYHFPSFERARLDSGLTVVTADVPGRPLLAAHLVLPGGVANEPAAEGGVTVLAARGMTEGTQDRDAIDFVESAERLGAELHADASWEALAATLEVPRSRFADALALLAEMVLQPRFPETEIERLRDERLNDLLQARADPRRRAERVFPETIYDERTPYSRPLGGTDDTVRRLDRSAVARRHARALVPDGATLIVAGDLRGLDVAQMADRRFGDWQTDAAAAPSDADATAHPEAPRVVVVDRPGSAQSELRIGHVGLSRRTPDFHAVAVLNAILGGTFNSRLNRLIREEKGYTYAIHSSFEMRRAAGPFVIRAAVETAVTVPAVIDILGVLRSIRESEPDGAELDAARDFLVGVFPLRFEAAAQVAGALAGLIIHELPDDELDRYRPRIAAVSGSEVLAAARAHVRPDDTSVVIVGDAARVEAGLREAGLGPLTVVPADTPAR